MKAGVKLDTGKPMRSLLLMLELPYSPDPSFNNRISVANGATNRGLKRKFYKHIQGRDPSTH